MFKRALIVFGIAVLLAACETPTTQRYSISADNNQALKAINTTGVGVRPFVGPSDFSSTCRALGPMKVSDNLTHTEYIQKAFEDELKVAGAFAQGKPRVSIGGKVNKLEFSSSKGLTGGYWRIDLTLTSSNGRTVDASEYYDFNSGFSANEACRNTAEAYSRAVQNLVGKAVRTAGFAELFK